MIEEALTKRRLLDALEYIDDEYIASAARYKMKIKPHASEPPVQTVGGSLKKYWKQYLGLVACLLLLSMATPILNFVAQTINSIAGSWGSGTIEATSDVIDTEENTFETENELFDETTEWYDAFADYTPIPLTEEKKREIEEASERLLGKKIRWYEELENGSGMIYLGTFDNLFGFGECIIMYNEVKTATDSPYMVYIAGHSFSIELPTQLMVYTTGSFHELKDVYYYGQISADDVGRAASYLVRVKKMNDNK